jgi:uncharacterized protein YceK
MRNGLISLMVGGLLALAGCDTTPDAGSQFNGAYVGTSTLTRGTNGWCGPENLPASGTIRDGRFVYAASVQDVLQPVVVQSQVHVDGGFSGGGEYFEPNSGMFSGHINQVTVVGHVAGDTLDADVNSLRCGRHLSLRRG